MSDGLVQKAEPFGEPIARPRGFGWRTLVALGLFAIGGCDSRSTPSAVSIVQSQPSQTELATAFASSTAILYAASSPAELSAIKPHQQVNLTNGDGGLVIEATGEDPGLILPEIRIDQPCLVKIVITAPVESAIQLFFLARGTADYDEAHSIMHPLLAGKNVIYCKLDTPNLTGALRLDPGAAPGRYLLESLEIKAVSAPSSP